MKSFLIVLFALSATLFADIDEQMFQHVIQNVQKEVSPTLYTKDYESFKRNYNEIVKLNKEVNVLKQQGFEKHIENLKSLQEINKKNPTLILSQLIIEHSLRNISLKNPKQFFEITLDSIEHLYKNNMCDGYLFYATYKNSLKGERNNAISILNNGEKVCRVDWKKMQIISRKQMLRAERGDFK